MSTSDQKLDLQRDELKRAGCRKMFTDGFRSLHESIDTTTSGGRLIFHVFSARAQLERDLIRERTTAGLAAARARQGGRKPVLNGDQETSLRKLAADRNTPVFICATLGISRTSSYRYLAKPSKPAALPPAAASSSPAAPTRTKHADRKRSAKPAQRAAGAAAKSYSERRRKPGRRGPV